MGEGRKGRLLLLGRKKSPAVVPGEFGWDERTEWKRYRRDCMITRKAWYIIRYVVRGALEFGSRYCLILAIDTIFVHNFLLVLFPQLLKIPFLCRINRTGLH
jgi:hypothetical protein